MELDLLRARYRNNLGSHVTPLMAWDDAIINHRPFPTEQLKARGDVTPPTAAPDKDLTPREHELIAAAKRGDEVVRSKLKLKELAASEDPKHVIHARVLRDLLIGRHEKLDPHGVQLANARIVDALDLDGVHANAGLWLENCVLDGPLQATFATLPFLVLRKVRSTGIMAHGLRVENDLVLTRVKINGGVDLAGAHIAGNIVLTTVKITNPGGSALIASRIRVDGGFFLHKRVLFTGTKAIRLANAHVTENFGTRGDDATCRSTQGTLHCLTCRK